VSAVPANTVPLFRMKAESRRFPSTLSGSCEEIQYCDNKLKRLIFSPAFLVALELGAHSTSWHFVKDDPATGQHLVEIHAKSFDQTAGGHIKYLHDMTARPFDARGSSFRHVRSKEAIINMQLGTLAYGPPQDRRHSKKPKVRASPFGCTRPKDSAPSSRGRFVERLKNVASQSPRIGTGDGGDRRLDHAI
jgi:hypothetical protein